MLSFLASLLGLGFLLFRSGPFPFSWEVEIRTRSSGLPENVQMLMWVRGLRRSQTIHGTGILTYIGVVEKGSMSLNMPYMDGLGN